MQQGNYPIGSRVLAATDTATGVVTGATADIPMQAIAVFVGQSGLVGTITSFSFTNINGFTGTVTNPTTTPVLAIGTSISGILKGNGTGMVAAAAGIDYSAGTAALATGIVKSTTGTGALSIATPGTDYAPATSGSSILYGNGAGGFNNASVGAGLSFTAGTLSAPTMTATVGGLVPTPPNNTTTFLRGDGTFATPSGAGTVTTVSVVTANGFAGTVANPTTTPAITLTTSISGILKGNGTAVGAATSGTDYAPATSGSSVLSGNSLGGFTNVTIGSNLTFTAGTLAAPTMTATVGGAVPTPPNNTTTFLRGDGTFATPTGGGSTTIVHPQLRLTLASNTPVLTADTSAATSIFYTPYIGNSYPSYNGTSFSMRAISQLTLTLNTTNHVNATVYDIYVFNNSGTDTIVSGPAWSTKTARQAAVALTQINGIWVNNVAFTGTAFNGATAFTVPVNQGTYVGTFYTTAAGQTSMVFNPASVAGGNNTMLALYNAYNQVPTSGSEGEGTANINVSPAATWQVFRTGFSNAVNFVDGLQQSQVQATFQVAVGAPTTGTSMSQIGVNLDSTTATPSFVSQTNINSSTSQLIVTMNVSGSFAPQLGFHTVYPMHEDNTTTTSWNPNGVNMRFKIQLNM